MKKVIVALLLLALSVPLAIAAPPEISNVSASQRDGTKLVDIYYDAADPDGDTLTIRIEVSDNDGVRYSVPAFSLTGDIGEGIAPGTGKHIVWDAGTDWDGEYSDLMRVMVFAVDAQGYPGLEWGSEVPPGGFLLGQDGGAEGSGPSRHVNIPWSYWLSKYEITAQQYCDFLNTAYTAGKVVVSNDNYGAYVFSVSNSTYSNFKGTFLLCDIGDSQKIRWNVNNFEVVSNLHLYPADVTWYGAMAFAQFYGYDLPTEAEWEKGARGPDFDDQDEHCLYTWGNDKSDAKANFDYNSNKNSKQKPVGYYDGNQTPIGPDMVNGYGCYDMTGNASEWTRTLAEDYSWNGSDHNTFGISDYPQQEDLDEKRNQYWLACWSRHGTVISYCAYSQFVNKSGAPIYNRDYGQGSYPYGANYQLGDNYQRFGFRVIRRYIPDDSTD